MNELKLVSVMLKYRLDGVATTEICIFNEAEGPLTLERVKAYLDHLTNYDTGKPLEDYSYTLDFASASHIDRETLQTVERIIFPEPL